MEVIGVNRRYIFEYKDREDRHLGNTRKFPSLFFVLFESQ